MPPLDFDRAGRFMREHVAVDEDTTAHAASRLRLVQTATAGKSGWKWHGPQATSDMMLTFAT
jgi:hypothetical protein